MANVHDDSAGAEHPGFLQKLKHKLHFGQKQKPKEVPEATTTTDPAVSSEERNAPATDSTAAPSVKAEPEPSVAKPNEPDVAAAPSLKAEPEPALAKPTEADVEAAPSVTAEPDLAVAKPNEPEAAKVAEEPPAAAAEDSTRGGEFFDSEEVFSKAGQGEAHDGLPTFLAALPEQDIPNEKTKEKLHHVTEEEKVHHGTDSTEVVDPEAVYSAAQEGEHHSGVPTFMVVLPGETIPEEEEINRKLHHVTEEEKVHHVTDSKAVEPEDVFSNAQEEGHHGGVPTFLAALPDQEIPNEETKAHLHHVTEEEKVHHSPERTILTPEELLNNPAQEEPHGGVPTFLAALPEQEIPNEETKAHLHHVTEEEKVHHSSESRGVTPENFSNNPPQEEHHGGVPTFLAALPEQEIPNEETKAHLHHVTEEEKVHHSPERTILTPEELLNNPAQEELHGGVPTNK